MNASPSPGADQHAPVARTTGFILVLVCALVLRAAWIAAVPVMPVSDSVRYDLFAQNLAAGQGYVDETGPTAYWPVGPSFLFSLCYRIAGPQPQHRFLAVALLNLLMSTGSVALTLHLARKWFTPRVALGAGLLLALWPSQIQFTTVLNSEIPMVFFVLAGLAAWTADRPALPLRGALAGAFLAAAAFMRPTALLLPLVFALARLVTHPRRLATLGAAGVMLATMLALLLPWSLRNQRTFGEFVLISTNGGVNFWMGNNPDTTGFYQPPPKLEFAGEAERDRRLRSAALSYIRSDPPGFLKRTAIKAVRLHERETIGLHWNSTALQGRFSSRVITALKWTGQLYWWGVLLLALVGALRLLRRGPLIAVLCAPPILIWAYFTAVHAVTVIQDRYHFAAIPFIAMLAASALLPRPRRSPPPIT